MSVIPAVGRLRQDDAEFKASIGNIARRRFKKGGYVWRGIRAGRNMISM